MIKEYKKAKNEYQNAIMHEKYDNKITEKYYHIRNQYINNIRNNNTAILLNGNDSFERIIAFIKAFIEYYIHTSEKADNIAFRDIFINEFIALINKLVKKSSHEMGSNISAVEYILTEDITDDIFADLVKKIGWESIFQIEGVEYSEGLVVDYQLEEYNLIVLNDKVELIENIENIILVIEINTDFFDNNNDEINAMIDETLSKVIK